MIGTYPHLQIKTGKLANTNTLAYSAGGSLKKKSFNTSILRQKKKERKKKTSATSGFKNIMGHDPVWLQG
jgi:hypothetical protein